jgi:serine/threonine protein kinase
MPTPTSDKKTIDIRREVKRCPMCEQRFSRDAAFCPFDGVKLETALVDLMSDPLIRTRIDGRYDIVGVLGEGGMGRVYEVRHVSLHRPFAMKVLRTELARDEDLAERFIREATATASVKHPNVVQITDFGRFPDGTPYFVMDLLIGHTLGEVLKAGGPVPAGRAVRIVRKIAGALGAAHAAGVVHRDLKPDNVFLVGGSRDVVAPDDPDRGRSLALLSYEADVRVMDFGAAKIVGSSRVTRAGIVFGTPHYMSPEQAAGQPVDHRADIYAVGVIMYEMFAGRVPFEADTYMGVLTQHMLVQPVAPSRVAEAARGLGALEGITLRCLAKRPEDRYASMEDLIRAIDDVVQLHVDDPNRGAQLGAIARPSAGAVRRRMGDDPELPSLAEMRSGLESARPRRRPVAWVPFAAIAGGLVAALLAVGFFVPREPSRAVDLRAPAMPAPTNSAGREVPVGLVAAPSPTLIPAAATVATAAPSVGEGASASAPPPRRHGRTRAVPSPGSSGSLDDVGDPFAGKP